MKAWKAVAAVALALVSTACGPGKSPGPVARLDCPATEGRLKRQSATPDGKSCIYRTAEGGEVDLRLVPAGDLDSTLASLEREVRSLSRAPVSAPAVSEKNATAGAKAYASRPESEEVDESDEVEIHMPGLHIVTRGEDADVRIGKMTVNTDDNGAIVRWVRDVRMIGKATSREKRGVRALFIIAGPDGEGRTSAAYHAAGPKTGPLAVALVKWRNGDEDGDLQDEVRRLVRRNGGA